MADDVLIYADTVRSPELRHEVPLTVPDPFVYLERGGERHIVASAMELPRLAEAGDYVLHPFEEFGVDELRRSGLPAAALVDAVAVRAVRGLGLERARVPPSFPLQAADDLRAGGVELVPDGGLFDRRRRAKSGAELAGVRRAQRAAEAGMSAARELLARASLAADGTLTLEGSPLSSARVKAAVAAVLLAHGASAEEFVVSHGAQAAVAHHMGEGPLRAGETIVVDLWPRDVESACFADMTRTFVVGDVPAEVAGWHRLCRAVLDAVIGEVRPGVSARALYERACDIFEAEGYPTQRSKQAGETLANGFFHSLGHGVGLAVHEQPLLGLGADDPLVVGDILAVEPGLYRAGVGGVRLEDLVRVGEEGAENLTSFPYELAP